LLKIVGHIKGQTSGMNPYQPRYYVLPKKQKATKKHGGTRKKLPKSNTPAFRKQVINIIKSRNLTNTHKARLIQRYEEAARAGLATPNEISALVGLAELKYYQPRTLRRRK
jgi:hypothetical protein